MGFHFSFPILPVELEGTIWIRARKADESFLAPMLWEFNGSSDQSFRGRVLHEQALFLMATWNSHWRGGIWRMTIGCVLIKMRIGNADRRGGRSETLRHPRTAAQSLGERGSCSGLRTRGFGLFVSSLGIIYY